MFEQDRRKSEIGKNRMYALISLDMPEQMVKIEEPVSNMSTIDSIDPLIFILVIPSKTNSYRSKQNNLS